MVLSVKDIKIKIAFGVLKNSITIDHLNGLPIIFLNNNDISCNLLMSIHFTFLNIFLAFNLIFL